MEYKVSSSYSQKTTGNNHNS